ncbi:MAG TPA: hypothetical protein VM223_15765 [Planctomycetota bacterium]|nr:hypothetical protein [Planctomycetota bacterium]
MNTKEIHCRDCHALIGEIRDGALVRPMDAKAEHVNVGDLARLVSDGYVMSPVVNGHVACRTCGLLHQVSRRGEFGELTVTAEFREPFTAKRRAEMERSRTRK